MKEGENTFLHHFYNSIFMQVKDTGTVEDSQMRMCIWNGIRLV